MAAGQLLPATDRELLLTELRTELARRRRALGLSQARLAGRMGFDRTTVNKVERGAIEPSREFARQAERALEADGELWRRWAAFDAARRPRPPQGRQLARPVGPPPPSVVGHEQVDADQRRWVQVREGLNEHRLELSRLAARWHWRCQRIEGSDLLSRPEWLPACPVELGAVELADRHLLLGAGGTALARPTTRPLPFRTLIGDPFDLARRPLLPSIDTLTIRRSRHGASFVLHQRDAAQVAVAGGMYHVMPAGVFQPSSVSLAGLASDFDLWRNVQREYSEEFLGRSKRRAHHQDHGIPNGDQVGRRGNAHASLDHDGTAGTPIDYREEPFRSMDAARRSGRVRVWCLGVGLDPLTLWGEILTVAVFDDEVFDELFSGLVVANDEGVVVTMATPGRPAHGVPFVEERVAQLLGSEPVAPAAAACLALAWRERERLLAT